MPRRTLLLISIVAFAASPASAVQTREPSFAERYVRIRAADAAGDVNTAARELSVLLADDPANPIVAPRAYREALAAGDRALAERAAKALEAQNALPPDGPLLLAVFAIQAKDWTGANAQLDRLEQGKLFSFLVPMLRAWVSLGAGDGKAMQQLEAARAIQLASGYYPTQHALLLVASGNLDAGAAEVRAMQGAGTRMKLLVGAAFARAGRKADAMVALAGDDPVLAAARDAVSAGKPVALAPEGPAEGVSDMLVQVALDFNRQKLAPVALVLARIATFAAPDNSGAWLAVANMLGTADQHDVALAAVDRVSPSDPFYGGARTLRVALLIDKGDKQAALTEAQAAVARARVGIADWARLGDVYQSLDRPADAATAYQKALDLSGKLPVDQQWPLWLQMGSTLEIAGDWPRAKAALAKAYALAPDEPIVLNHLGYSKLSRREDINGATKLIEQASKLRPNDSAITDSLGWAYYVRGDAADAVPILERAVIGQPGEPTINEHLGDAYWTVGRQIEARYAWRAALVTADAKDAGRIRAKLEGALTSENAAP